MWLQANLHPKLLLPEKAEEQADISSWAPPRLLACSKILSQTRTPLHGCNIPNEGWDRDGGLFRTPSALPAPLLPFALSVIMRPLACVYPQEHLESHICITQTSDRKLGCHSLWAIVPALVGNSLVCKSTQWTITAPSDPWVSYPAAAVPAKCL